MTAKNNRTLRIGGEERESLMQMIDGQSLIHGDLFDVLPTLPDGFANLIIVDPPYNLPRNFGDKKFTVVSPRQYEEYLRSWFSLLCDKLAPDGTLYMCGDWRCSSSMQRVIEERLTILNRITWHGEGQRGCPQLEELDGGHLVCRQKSQGLLFRCRSSESASPSACPLS